MNKREIGLFLLSGGIAAGVNFFSRILLNQWLSFPVAVALAYVLGMVTAYCLNRQIVFTDTRQTLAQSVFYFVIINLLALAQTWGISVALYFYLFPWMDMRFFPREISHGVGIVIPVFTSYLGHKYFSFR